MTTLSFLITVISVIALDTAWVAFFRARPVGKFEVLRDNKNAFSFSSKIGIFTVNKDEKRLYCTVGNSRSSVSLSEVTGIEYRVSEKTAILEELLFGLEIADLMPAYRDTIEWFSISAVTSGGKRIPLYLSGSYCPREFLMSWYIEFQAELLTRLGLLKDVEEQSHAALSQIQAALGNPKLL